MDGKRCSLQWAKPYNGGSPVEVYTVSVWKLLTGNGSKETPKTWNTTETRYTLVDLEWNQNYTTAVSAWNRYGQGFYGVERHFRTAKRPGGKHGLCSALFKNSTIMNRNWHYKRPINKHCHNLVNRDNSPFKLSKRQSLLSNSLTGTAISQTIPPRS